jgi:hypothetical protein
MLIDPPTTSRNHHKQKTAEQERRAMKLLLPANRGLRAAKVGRHPARRGGTRSRQQRARGRAASIKIAEGKAQAIQLVNEAAEKLPGQRAKAPADRNDGRFAQE